MRIVILGSGQLAKALNRLTDWKLIPGRTSFRMGFENVLAFRPDVIINCSGSTLISKDLSSYRDNYLGNYKFVLALGKKCHDKGIRLLHISTNAVFDSSDTALFSKPSDISFQDSFYGRSKALGEQSLSHLGEKAKILRLTSLYGESKSNFFARLSQQIRDRKLITVFDNVYSQPTSCFCAAVAIQNIAENWTEFQDRCYHFACKRSYSKYEQASIFLSRVIQTEFDESKSILGRVSKSKDEYRMLQSSEKLSGSCSCIDLEQGLRQFNWIDLKLF